jgi:hypothetical protein
MSKRPVELLSTQIAEAMVASCNAKIPSIDDLLNDTLTTIIEQIRNNNGPVRLVGWARRAGLSLVSNDTIIEKFNSLKSKIDPANLHAMSVSASKRDVASLSKTIRAIIDELDYTDDYINSIFEANPTSGGRGITRKQKQAARTRRHRHRHRHRYSRRN